MRASKLWVVVTSMLLAAAVMADGTVTLTVASSKDAKMVAPGSAVDWTIQLTVSNDPPGQNYGLALISVDFRQADANPAKLEIPPAVGVPTPMANFSRPEGISNPGEGSSTTGYVGVQRGTPGAMNLTQVGGGQNTFGEAGSSMGTNPNVVSGVGQPGPETVAQGSFLAPATAGSYTFRIDGALANVLDEVNTPPDYSPVSSATIVYAAQTFTFAVGQPGDLNCDGAINTFDIDPFVLALTNPSAYATTYPNCDFMLGDINTDGSVNTFDIDPFVALLTGG